MRVVGGIYKGRTLLEFKGNEVRPTSDMARESLFNILQFKISDKSFLDLFCGTGAVGIEAKSRGAKRVVLNDNSKESVRLAKSNLQKLGITDIEVKNCDATLFIKSTSEKFDYIFIDAPYKSEDGLNALNFCSTALNSDGTVIYENEQPFNLEVQGLIKTDERRYGRAYLTFFNKV